MTFFLCWIEWLNSFSRAPKYYLPLWIKRHCFYAFVVLFIHIIFHSLFFFVYLFHSHEVSHTDSGVEINLKFMLRNIIQIIFIKPLVFLKTIDISGKNCSFVVFFPHSSSPNLTHSNGLYNRVTKKAVCNVAQILICAVCNLTKDNNIIFFLFCRSHIFAQLSVHTFWWPP